MNGMTLRRPGRAVIAVEFHGHVVVVVDGVFELDALQLRGTDGLRIEVLARSDGGFLDEAVRHRLAERVAVDHVLERDGLRAHGLGRSGQFEAKNGLKTVDGVRAGARAIAVRLIHQQDEIVELGEIFVIALTDGFLKALHARLAARTFFLVDLIDVEDVDMNV